MCTFCSDIPSDERPGARKSYISLFLKPNSPDNPKEAYRFRLLNFRSPTKNDRSYPFISRFVHVHWGVNENGMRVVDDTVVCPSSPFVDARNDLDLGFADTFKELKLRDKKPTWDCICPMCRHVAEAWNAWKSSGKTDKVAMERISSMKKQFQGIIPVYVVNDPVNEKNNGRFKCIVLNNQDEYKRLVDLVNSEVAKCRHSGAYSWCNGQNAVDLYLRMEKVPVIYNEGKANERESFARRITRMTFGTKPYDLLDNNGSEIITKEAIDKFEFDDQFYVKSSKSELEEFYKKYYSFVSKNIPDEDLDMLADTPAATPVRTTESVSIPQNPVAQDKPKTSFVDDLLSDPDDLPAENTDHDAPLQEKPAGKPGEQSVEEMLKELDFTD